MNETKIQFPFITLTICLASATIILLSIYSSIHWPIQQNAYRIKNIVENQLTDNMDIEPKLKEIGTASQKIIESGYSAMRIAALYHITGLSCFFVSIIGIFHRKGVTRFIPLPFGIIAGILGILTM